MTSWHVDFAMAVLIGTAWAWHRGCDKVLAVLAVSFVAAATAGPLLHNVDRHVVLGIIDYAIVFFMLGVWTKRHDRRAHIIGLIGLGKLVWRSSWMAEPMVSHQVFAVGINLAFASQIAVAGGFVDVVGNWISDRLRRYLPRRSRLFRNVEG